MRPIDGDTAFKTDKQFVCNDLQGIIAHHLHRALVFSESIVKCDFCLRESLAFTTLACRANILGKGDKLLQHFDRTNSVSMVPSNRGL